MTFDYEVMFAGDQGHIYLVSFDMRLTDIRSRYKKRKEQHALQVLWVKI